VLPRDSLDNSAVNPVPTNTETKDDRGPEENRGLLGGDDLMGGLTGTEW
jgi:hypothetical protein